MGRRRAGSRVLGPYRDKRGFKYKLAEGGETTWFRCRTGCTEAEAEAEVAGAREALSAPVGLVDVEAAVAAYTAHMKKRVAALLPLLGGLSSGEVLHLQVGDVDLSGSVIWIRADEDAEIPSDWDVKSASRCRSVELPDLLRADLEALARGRGPETYLFQQRVRGSVGKAGTPRSPGWLRKLVRRVCEDAGVRVVPPHGLRDTHASVMRALLGRSPAQIGEALGHGDHGRTAERHYIGAPRQAPTLRLVRDSKG